MCVAAERPRHEAVSMMHTGYEMNDGDRSRLDQARRGDFGQVPPSAETSLTHRLAAKSPGTSAGRSVGEDLNDRFHPYAPIDKKEPAPMTHREIIRTLNHLIETCKDATHGFAACAKHTLWGDLRSRMLLRASECETAAAEQR